MATYYVDDGGDGSTESSWATAATSINALDTEYIFASGDIVYFGHDSVCQATNAATLTITGPAATYAPMLMISATQNSSPPAYQASTTYQIDTSEAATYDLKFDGAFALWGMSVKSGKSIVFDNLTTESVFAKESRFALGPAGVLSNGYGTAVFQNITVDLTQDGTTNRAANTFVFGGYGKIEINGLTFINPGYRTSPIFKFYGNSQTAGACRISGGDFSGFQSSTPIVDCTSLNEDIVFSHCITPASPTYFYSTLRPGASGSVMFVNCGPENSPAQMAYRDSRGDAISTNAVYRNGGSAPEDVPWAWNIITTASVNEGYSFKTPWIYGEFATTGTKTLALHITNETADFTDAEVCIEMESFGTAGEAKFSFATDARLITDAATAQGDDTTSTWTGVTGTYKQRLETTVSVAQTGMFRVRACFGVASIASGRSCYVDPLAVVS